MEGIGYWLFCYFVIPADKYINFFFSAAEDRDEGIPNFETLIQHDCNTIRPFDRTNLDNMEDWIAQGRTFKTKNTFVKYNHAYGIPILGREYFTDDSMRRACYLVRWILIICTRRVFKVVFTNYI